MMASWPMLLWKFSISPLLYVLVLCIICTGWTIVLILKYTHCWIANIFLITTLLPNNVHTNLPVYLNATLSDVFFYGRFCCFTRQKCASKHGVTSIASTALNWKYTTHLDYAFKFAWVFEQKVHFREHEQPLCNSNPLARWVVDILYQKEFRCKSNLSFKAVLL